MKYRCLILDDEPIAIRVIKNHLMNFYNIELVAECSNAFEAMEYLSGNTVDLAFLDIQMPQINGVDFLRSLSSPPKIIFVTAYRDYAIDAFELDVVDYLLKPVALPRFTKAINRFYKLAESPPQQTTETFGNHVDHIFLKADKKLHKLLFADIIYVESMGDYVNVHTTNGRLTSKERISKLEEMLPNDRFIRVHRGFLVSTEHITAILPGQLELSNIKVPIGRNYRSIVEKLVKSKE